MLMKKLGGRPNPAVLFTPRVCRQWFFDCMTDLRDSWTDLCRSEPGFLANLFAHGWPMERPVTIPEMRLFHYHRDKVVFGSKVFSSVMDFFSKLVVLVVRWGPKSVSWTDYGPAIMFHVGTGFIWQTKANSSSHHYGHVKQRFSQKITLPFDALGFWESVGVLNPRLQFSYKEFLKIPIISPPRPGVHYLNEPMAENVLWCHSLTQHVILCEESIKYLVYSSDWKIVFGGGDLRVFYGDDTVCGQLVRVEYFSDEEDSAD